jgi:phage N-6-adenine-methyltransferase
MVAGIPRNNVETEKSEWCTPIDLYNKLDAEFHFNLDAACTNDNCLCKIGLTKENDALTFDWSKLGHSIFLNPPYGRGVIESFIKKAYLTSQAGSTVVCLVPLSGASWFRKYCLKADEIRIIGRVKYIGFAADGTLIRNSPTFDSCIVVFRPGEHIARLTEFRW